MTLAEQFGSNLRSCRRERGLTQEMLARMARVTRDAIHKLENGYRVPRLDTVVRLCDALCVEPNELLVGLRP